MSYVLSLTVGDSTRKLILVGYANHAHKDGTSAWASPKTVGEYADCSERTVQRHLSVLLTEGYLREGNQQLVAHLPADRRPIVYDVSMSTEVREQWRSTYEESGRRATAAAHGRKRGDTLTPRRGDTHDATGVTGASPRGVTPVTERGDTAMSPEPSLNRPVEPSKEPAASGGPKSPEQEADEVAAWWWESLDPRPVRAGTGTGTGYPGFRNLIRGARLAGFTQHEIAKALQAVRDRDGTVWPSTQQLDRACRAIREGRPERVTRPSGTRHMETVQDDKTRAEQRAMFEETG